MRTRWWLLVPVASLAGGSLCSGQTCTGTANQTITMTCPIPVQTDVFTITWADTYNTSGQFSAQGSCAPIEFCSNGMVQINSYRQFAPMTSVTVNPPNGNTGSYTLTQRDTPCGGATIQPIGTLPTCGPNQMPYTTGANCAAELD
jgi:hypothetical protein